MEPRHKVQVGYCWVVCHKPLWSHGTVSWSRSLISVDVNIPTSKLDHVTRPWGVSRQVSKSPVDCGSAVGCRLSCLFAQDVVLLSLLLGCRVRLVLPGSGIAWLAEQICELGRCTRARRPLLSSSCSGAGRGTVGLHRFRVFKRVVGVLRSLSTGGQVDITGAGDERARSSLRSSRRWGTVREALQERVVSCLTRRGHPTPFRGGCRWAGELHIVCGGVRNSPLPSV